MHKYFVLLLLTISGCHQITQPMVQPRGADGTTMSPVTGVVTPPRRPDTIEVDSQETGIPTTPSVIGDDALPTLPDMIKVNSQETAITFSVSILPCGSEPRDHTFLLLETDHSLTVDQVMEMISDIVDAFITLKFFPLLQVEVKTSEAASVKITCIATGEASTTQSTDVSIMTPYLTEVTVEE